MSTITNAAAGVAEFVPTAGFFIPQGPEDVGVRVMAARLVKLSSLAQAKLEHQLAAMERRELAEVDMHAGRFRVAWLSEAEVEAIAVMRQADHGLREHLCEFLQKCVLFRREMVKLRQAPLVSRVLVFPGEEALPQAWFGARRKKAKGKVQVPEVAAKVEAGI